MPRSCFSSCTSSSPISGEGSTTTTRSGGAAASQRSTAARISDPENPFRKAACSASRIISSRPFASGSAVGPRPPHEHARPPLQLDVARPHEVLVGGGDGVVVDLEPARQRADAGQPLAMGEGAVQDLQLELRHELIADGDAAAPIEDEVQRHTAPPIDGVRGLCHRSRPHSWTPLLADRTPPRPWNRVAAALRRRPWLSRLVFYTFVILRGRASRLLRGPPPRLAPATLDPGAVVRGRPGDLRRPAAPHLDAGGLSRSGRRW